MIRGPNGEILYRANPKVVCRECEFDDESVPAVDNHVALPATDGDNNVAHQATSADLFPDIDEDSLSIERLAALAESYRPDANSAPDLFAGINVAPRIISEQIAYLIQDARRDVIRRGTGIRARRALGRDDLSGKTGTSNDGRDAWFAGQ